MYCKVQKEVEKRYTGSSNFPYSTGQIRTKFKRCIAEYSRVHVLSNRRLVLKEFKKNVVMGHGSTSYFPWCSQEILATQSLQRSLPPVAMPRVRWLLKPAQRTKAKNCLSPEKDPGKRKRRKAFWHLWSRFWKICPNRTLLLTFGIFFRKKMNEPESMKCDSFNCLCLVLGVKHLPLISLHKVKACRRIIFLHWIPLDQVICTISPQVQWWLVLHERIPNFSLRASSEMYQ